MWISKVNLTDSHQTGVHAYTDTEPAQCFMNFIRFDLFVSVLCCSEPIRAHLETKQLVVFSNWVMVERSWKEKLCKTTCQIAACRVMLQQCALGTLSANRRWAKESVWISSQLTDESGTKCLHGIVCLSNRCCIWVSDIVYVWTDVMHVSVRTHGTAPPLSECVCLSKSMPQWKCVCTFVPKEKILCMVTYGWLRRTERVFIKGLWVVLFVSFTVRKKTSH